MLAIITKMTLTQVSP
uniref:Uncharacterized protein n=1 Tax=Anguilla anguilla TaxID=7936 RepID=A0A0E9R7C2_ANGAN